MDEQQKRGIRDLYPDLDNQQLVEAETFLESYAEIALRIFERLEAERKAFKP